MSEKDAYTEINRQMASMLTKIDYTIQRVEAIHGKIVGSELHPVGMIEDLEGVKKEVKELQDFKKSIKWTASGLLLGAGYGGFKLIQGVIHWFSTR